MPAARPPGSLRILSFVQEPEELWGVVVGGSLAVGAGEHRLVAQLQAAPGDGETDRFRCPAGELSLTPVGEPVHHQERWVEQRCRVDGELTVGSRSLTVSALGIDVRLPAAAPGGSLRCACAIFSSEDSLTLTALRPRDASGHDRDVVSAAAWEQGVALAVSEPLLSTTYDEAGCPCRAGLELWCQTPEEEAEYPRRAAGVAAGAGLSWADDGLRADARRLQWRSRGQSGSGSYLLIRFS